MPRSHVEANAFRRQLRIEWKCLLFLSVSTVQRYGHLAGVCSLAGRMFHTQGPCIRASWHDMSVKLQTSQPTCVESPLVGYCPSVLSVTHQWPLSVTANRWHWWADSMAFRATRQPTAKMIGDGCHWWADPIAPALHGSTWQPVTSGQGDGQSGRITAQLCSACKLLSFRSRSEVTSIWAILLCWGSLACQQHCCWNLATMQHQYNTIQYVVSLVPSLQRKWNG